MERLNLNGRDDPYDDEFDDYDLNNDGVISRDEFARLEANFNERSKKAIKKTRIGGVLLLLAFTALSAISSFLIYKKGFQDLAPDQANIGAALWVLIQEGFFGWLLYGFKKAFTANVERFTAVVGMGFAGGAMIMNVWTHFFIASGRTMYSFQTFWLDWGSFAVFAGGLVIVLVITLGDPFEQLCRAMLKQVGREQQVKVDAKMDALDSGTVAQAASVLARRESRRLARQLTGEHPIYAERSDDRSGGHKRPNAPTRRHTMCACAIVHEQRHYSAPQCGLMRR